METVFRQYCSETDLRTDLPPNLPKEVLLEIEMKRYERKDETTFIAYCDHENCNTKDFIETRLKESTQDNWTLISSSPGTLHPSLHSGQKCLPWVVFVWKPG